MKIYPVAGYPKNSRKTTFTDYKAFPTTSEKDFRDISSAKNLTTDQFCKNLSFQGITDEAQKGIKTLYQLTSSPLKAQEFIGKITQNPSQSKENVRKLLEEHGLNNKEGLKKFTYWFFSSRGYYGAYEKFVENYFKNAKSIEELLKFQPNWAPWKLEQKAWELKHPKYAQATEGTKNELIQIHYNYKREIPFRIGALPEVFPSYKFYKELIQKLKTQDIKSQIVEINGKQYDLQRLKGGELNNKFIYLLKSEEGKYIVKLDRINIEDARSLDYRELSLIEKRATRQDKYLAADSIYANVCMSKYLELNGCHEVPPVLYYDYKTNSAIFKYVDDVEGDAFQQIQEAEEKFLDLNKMNHIFKRLNSLGIYINDSSIKNILKSPQGINMLIDLGHADYMDTLKPGVKYYNVKFSNSSGPDLGAFYTPLFRSWMGLD